MKQKNKKPIVRSKTRATKEIVNYDKSDVSQIIGNSKALKFEDLGFKLPDSPPTQVVSIRLPTALLNKLRVLASERDIPYQALIKLLLAESLDEYFEDAA